MVTDELNDLDPAMDRLLEIPAPRACATWNELGPVNGCDINPGSPFRSYWQAWVSLPHATFAVAARHGKIVAAAPIARWAVGKPEREVADYYRRKGAQFTPLEGG